MDGIDTTPLWKSLLGVSVAIGVPILIAWLVNG